jgi:DNA repair exonuclease SbcCD ATPase subunit
MAEQAEKDTAPERDGKEPEGKEPADTNLRGELERRKDAQKKAERELAELREKIIQFEDRDKSDLERAQERATRAETQLQQLSQKVTSLEKGAWVRSAAAEFNFHDPEDAVVNLTEQLAGFEDQREARRAVERLAKSKQHLTRQEKKDSRPSIGQVLANGQPSQPAGSGGQVAQMGPMQAHQVQSAQRELEFAEGLAKALGEFRSNWTSFGGS